MEEISKFKYLIYLVFKSLSFYSYPWHQNYNKKHLNACHPKPAHWTPLYIRRTHQLTYLTPWLVLLEWSAIFVTKIPNIILLYVFLGLYMSVLHSTSKIRLCFYPYFCHKNNPPKFFWIRVKIYEFQIKIHKNVLYKTI